MPETIGVDRAAQTGSHGGPGAGEADPDAEMPRQGLKVRWTELCTAMTELKDYVSGKLRRSLIVLWCAVGMILLIVCVNLSNLLLARRRRGARSLRCAARWAGRGSIVRQLLTESLVLAAVRRGSGGLGIAFGARVSRPPGIDCAPAVEQRSDRWFCAGVDRSDRHRHRRSFGLAPGLRMSAVICRRR